MVFSHRVYYDDYKMRKCPFITRWCKRLLHVVYLNIGTFYTTARRPSRSLYTRVNGYYPITHNAVRSVRAHHTEHYYFGRLARRTPLLFGYTVEFSLNVSEEGHIFS